MLRRKLCHGWMRIGEPVEEREASLPRRGHVTGLICFRSIHW